MPWCPCAKADWTVKLELATDSSMRQVPKIWQSGIGMLHPNAKTSYGGGGGGDIPSEAVPLVEFMYLAFIHMPGELPQATQFFVVFV